MSLLVILFSLVACLPRPEKFDVDNDGYMTPEDCDDNDDAIHPGASEAWYDGIDQDCLGDDDFDADSDGFTNEGGDCDDEDATISPDAEEIWYDGVDQDCRDDNDYDSDHDGYDWAHDCDEANATIHEEAEELWYNGVDENCDANDGDRDGDGYTQSGYTFSYLFPGTAGIGDCLDENASVSPAGIEDPQNDLDDDCDGLLDEPWQGSYHVADMHNGLEGEGNDFTSFGLSISSEAFDVVSPSDVHYGKGDIFEPTTDGYPDFLVSAPAIDASPEDRAPRAVYLVTGGYSSADVLGSVSTHSVMRIEWIGGTSLFGMQAEWVPSFDGDFIPDILVSSPDQGTGQGGSVMVFGSEGWDMLGSPSGTWWGASQFDAAFFISSSEPFFGEAASLGNINEDRASEIAVCAPARSIDGTASAEGRIAVYPIPDTPKLTPAELFESDMALEIVGYSTTYANVGRAPPVMADFSGNGDPDLVVSSRDTNWDSSHVSRIAHGRLDEYSISVDLADHHISSNFDFPLLGDRLASGGDLNGDGIEDLAIAAHHHDDATVYVLSGTDVAEGGTRSVTGHDNLQVIGLAAAYQVSMDCSLIAMNIRADINQDGFSDLVIGSTNTGMENHAGAAILIYGDATPWGSRTTDEVDATFSGLDNSYLGFGGLSVVNVTDSQSPELIIGAPGFDAQADVDAGVIFVLDPLNDL